MPSFDSALERVIAVQRQIHADPEIGFDTVRTAGLVADELTRIGVPVREGIGKTGVVGDIEVPGATRCIALRADMDALPMEEDNNLPHKSQNPGAAHLCGHDAHTAMLLGAASLLWEKRAELPCSIRFLFQPNEEALPGGAPAMIADGCLDGVDRVFGMHVWPLLATGHVGLHVGPTMAQPDCFEIRLRGIGGHAAAPHHCADSIVALSQIVTAVQTIVSRNTNPLDSAVVSVTQVHAGTADNVIPESAWLRGTIRTFRPEVAEFAHRRLREITEAIATALGVTAEIDITIGYPVVMNDADSCDEAQHAIDAMSSELTGLKTTRDVTASLGGEDFAYYQQQIPGTFLFLGNYDEAQGIVHFCHHPCFRVDDAAMRHGLATWLAIGTQASPSR